ncbi:MAG: amino acid transporter [Verrucomicrobia bacterium]|nr:amino acid transporter [Verrucomicrobiota bacterium]
MCLTGVDYFSTLGYQPGIAFLAAGALSPLATLVLVLLTLFGALPIYRRVAEESPHGEGSIAMLEHLLTWWKGKLFVLVLLGFAATDFIITITLSAADASAHLIENPFAPHFFHGQPVPITLFLVALLGAVFLKGFKEAIGIAVALVAVYLALNAIVVVIGLEHIVAQPHLFVDWKTALFAAHSSPVMMIGVSLLLFPKLALGLSGFETGVSMMPLVKGAPGDQESRPAGKIRHTHRLLFTAAMIMSLFLLSTALITTLLIPADAFRSEGPNGEPAGPANGRALAYLAHQFLGNGFGTVYDLSTIAILWFAGASAMAGLLNIVPRYLPRYGMAPEWTRAARPLVLIYTAIGFAVTLFFRASVDAQGGAYATGVLVLMTSAAVAVTLSVWRNARPVAGSCFALITLVFVYTTLVNVIERPDGLKIGAFFIAAIVLSSLVSRVWRTTELRVEKITLDTEAERFLKEMDARGELRIIANQPRQCNEAEYTHREQEQREDNNIPADEPIVFLEIYVRDPSEFSADLNIHGFSVGRHRVLRGDSAAVPNAIAAFLLHLRDDRGKVPHAYFNWTEGNPLLYLIHYVLSGEGDVAPVTREVLRKAEPDAPRRPAIHAGV